jgi:hypothetical protein
MSLAAAAPFAAEVWYQDEVSGARVGAVAGLSLSDNNTVASAAGLFGLCGRYVAANNEFLSIADHATLSCNDQLMTLFCWFKPSAISSYYVVHKEGAGGAEYYMMVRSGGSLRFGVSGTASWGTETLVNSSAGAVTTGAWHLGIGVHDPTGNVIGVSVNGANLVTTGHTAGIWDGNGAFQIGGNSTFGGYANSDIDEVGLLKGYAFTNADCAALWNGGAGVAYANWRDPWPGVRTALARRRRRAGAIYSM